MKENDRVYLSLKMMTHCSNSFDQHLYYYYNRSTTLDYDRRMDTFSSVDYDQRSQMHHHHDYGVETSDTALFDNIINSYEKSDHELDGELLTGTEFIQQI